MASTLQFLFPASYITFLTRGLIILASSILQIVNGRDAIAVWANMFLDDETNQGMREVFQTFRKAVGCTLTVFLFVSLYLARAPPSKTPSPLDQLYLMFRMY